MRTLTLALAIAFCGVLAAASTPAEAAWSRFNVCVHSKGTCISTVQCQRFGTSVTCTFRGSQRGPHRLCSAKVTFPGGWFQTGNFWTVSGGWVYTTTARNQYWARGQWLKPRYINMTCR